MTARNEKNRTNQQAFISRMRETHTQHKVWIAHDDMARLEALAVSQGWLNGVGKHAGQMNLQHTLTEVIKAGLAAMGKNEAEGSK